MAMTDFIAAVGFSSTNISGIAGKRNEQGELSILSYINEDATPFMKKGVVYNLTKATEAIKSIVSKLESELESKIAKVYVGISGQSLHSVKTTINRDLKEGTIISKEIINSMFEENNRVPVLEKNTLLLDTITQEYKVGNDYLIDPVGVPRTHIEGNYLNIVVRDTLLKNIEHCFLKANIDIAGYIVSPIAASHMLTTDIDKRSGCAYVDFGAETTTIAIYHADLLRFITVLPIGGNSITKDLTSLKVEMSEAENIKLEHGNLNYEDESKDIRETFYVGESKERELPISHVNNLIRARTEEIIQNVWNLIQISGFHEYLVAGFKITGGASNLPGIEEMITKITHIKSIKQGTQQSLFQCSNVISERFRKQIPHSYYDILAILNEGKENCCKIDKPVTPDIFEGENHISKQEKSSSSNNSKEIESQNKEVNTNKEEQDKFERKRLEEIRRKEEEQTKKENERIKKEELDRQKREIEEKKRKAAEKAKRKKGNFIATLTNRLNTFQQNLFTGPTDDDNDDNDSTNN